MSDDKRFDPTPSRLRKAQQDGDSARSSELCGAAAFGCGVVAAWLVSAPIAAIVRDWFARPARTEIAIAPAQMLPLCVLMLVPAACAAAGSVAAGWFQTRSFSFNLKVSFEKLNPAEGLKCMLSREAVITAIRSTIAVCVIGAALWPAILECIALAIGPRSPEVIAARTAATVVRAVLTALAIGIVFAFVDYAIVRASWLRRLRMSFEEVKRDFKEQDGDPHQRGWRKSLHRSLVNGSLTRVKDAAFVVCNPTHFAVAIAYNPPDVAVPRVLVRAVNDGAARVRALAREHGIPLVENAPLARSLFASTNPGEAIPRDAYLAVAQIVAALARVEVNS